MDIEDQIPAHLPFRKGGISPLWKRGVGGDFLNNMSFQFMDSLVSIRKILKPKIEMVTKHHKSKEIIFQRSPDVCPPSFSSARGPE